LSDTKKKAPANPNEQMKRNAEHVGLHRGTEIGGGSGRGTAGYPEKNRNRKGSGYVIDLADQALNAIGEATEKLTLKRRKEHRRQTAPGLAKRLCLSDD